MLIFDFKREYYGERCFEIPGIFAWPEEENKKHYLLLVATINSEGSPGCPRRYYTEKLMKYYVTSTFSVYRWCVIKDNQIRLRVYSKREWISPGSFPESSTNAE